MRQKKAKTGFVIFAVAVVAAIFAFAAIRGLGAG